MMSAGCAEYQPPRLGLEPKYQRGAVNGGYLYDSRYEWALSGRIQERPTSQETALSGLATKGSEPEAC